MACHSPLRAFQTKVGAPVSFSPPALIARVLDLPCGKCSGCRLDRSRQDAIRCVHEGELHEAKAFITLTYDDEHLPAGLTLVKDHWVDFMKRLRERVRRSEAPALLRFFMCGEYGELSGRPHYHAIIFGFDFPDKVLWKKSSSGEALYRSALLESVWSMGHSSVGSVTFESAAYVARYVMKKELGRVTPMREILDLTTGEIVTREHEFSLRSLKPGLGRAWLEKFGSDVYPRGAVVIDGVEVKPPRYYDKWFSELDPVEFERLRLRRQERASLQWDDNGPARLRVKEVVLNAKLDHLKRSLE